MATFKVVLEFAESNGATFNEVYYRDAATIADAGLIPSAVISARLRLLNYLNKLLRARVSSTDTQGVTATTPINLPGTNTDAPGGSTLVGIRQKPLPAGAAVVCVMSGSAGGSRRLWLRGANQGDYERDEDSGQDAFDPNFRKNFTAFAKTLSAAGFGIRLLGRANPVNNPKRKITVVNGVAADGTSLVTTDGLVALDLRQRLIITQASIKDLPGLNGHWQVLAAGGPPYKIAYRTPNNANVAGVNLGYAHAELYSAVSTFNSLLCVPDHMGTRTTKNPLTRSRGARRAVRVRTLA
jgi:hypothetical protein